MYASLTSTRSISPPRTASCHSLIRLRRRLRSAALSLGIVVIGATGEAQTSGHRHISWTYSGTSTSIKNGQGGPQQWPPDDAPVPSVTFGSSDTVEVAMEGTITATLRWVDGNLNPITNPPPPSGVFILQRTSVHWSYGGEEVSAQPGTVVESLEPGLPDAQYQSGREPNRYRTGTARKLIKADGSSGTITLPVTLLARLSFTCATGASGTATATATVTYNATEVAPADCYDFSGYPNSPPGPPGSTPCALDAATKLKGPLLDGTGYYTEGRAYTNQTAQHALEQLKKTAVFYVFGHGGDEYRSCQTFWAPGNQPDPSSGWGAIVQTTGARDYLEQQGMPRHNIVVLDERDGSGQLIIPSDAFRKVLLAVYQGCYTAELAGRGSPVQGTYNHGAKCVLGFRGTIRSHVTDAQGKVVVKGAEEWAEAFWQGLKDGQTVTQAAATASPGIPMGQGLWDRQILGSSTTRVHPARFGD